jgi:hypothetical protein
MTALTRSRFLVPDPWLLSLFLLLLFLLLPGDARAQGIVLRDLVFTAGASGERYEGNLPAVALPVVDSTERADAAVGELGVRGELRILEDESRTLGFRFDAGLRQFSASGFRLRDYSPQEWVGSGELDWTSSAGEKALVRAVLGTRLRSVRDRTPVPLFIEPGYRELHGGMGVAFQPRPGLDVTAEFTGEVTDFESLALLPQLDLLDRRSAGVEVGAEWGTGTRTRLSGSVRRYHYPEQGTFDPEDPFRRDLAFRGGATWFYQGPVFAELGLDGTLNRSNSNRPEYNAMTARALLAAPTPWWGVGVQFYATVTGKRYLTASPFARLVPGEEADNASLIYLQVSRPLAPNLDGALRFGWTRAETEIGDSYFQRYGASVLLNFRPWRQ